MQEATTPCSCPSDYQEKQPVYHPHEVTRNEADSSLNNPKLLTQEEGANQELRRGPHHSDKLITSTGSSWPKKDIKLFVGRVPRNYNEEMLQKDFEDFGTVIETTIIRDRVTSEHKGCAFVKMESIAEADALVRALHNTRVLDKSAGALQIKYAQGENERLGLPIDNGPAGADSVKLFVGSLPHSITELELQNLFEKFGVVDEVYIMKDENRAPKGCAFVKMNKEGAFHAIARLNGQYSFPRDGNYEGVAVRPLEVRFAENKKSHTMNYFGPMSAYTYNNPMTVGQWTEYRTQDGRAYYHNVLTNATQWELPVELQQAHNPTFTPGRPSVNVTGPIGANLFIFHIPNEWTNSDLYNHFIAFGTILSARIATCKNTKRNRGFAFVSYDNPASAMAAVQHMNGYQVVLPKSSGGATSKRLKVMIKRGEDGTGSQIAPRARPFFQMPPMNFPQAAAYPPYGSFSKAPYHMQPSLESMDYQLSSSMSGKWPGSPAMSPPPEMTSSMVSVGKVPPGAPQDWATIQNQER